MWETTALVEREQLVDAAPEKVWALAGDFAALSAMPAWFAFSLSPSVAGTNRLCCLLAASEVMSCAVLDVREEIPGQMIRWQTRSTQPSGKQFFTLSVRPRPRGSAVGITVSQDIPRASKIQYEAYWRRQVTIWSDRLRAVAEGRAPWPQAAMPADMQRACSARPLLKRPGHVSAAVQINAPAAAVWEVVWAPESARRIDPGNVADAGHVPGTPEREVGEMQYTVRRHPGDRLTAAVHVVRELTQQRSALTQHIGPPHDETLHLVTPVRGGTQLELTCRWPARAFRAAGRNAMATVEKNLQAMAERYKAIIEESPGPPDQ